MREAEEECATSEGRKGHGCEEREFASHPRRPGAARRLFRVLNFPRLNRRAVIVADGGGVVRCFLSLLSSARERREVAKAPVSSLTSYIPGAGVIATPAAPYRAEGSGKALSRFRKNSSYFWMDCRVAQPLVEFMSRK